jgi:hypothetical protein
MRYPWSPSADGSDARQDAAEAGETAMAFTAAHWLVQLFDELIPVFRTVSI